MYVGRVANDDAVALATARPEEGGTARSKLEVIMAVVALGGLRIILWYRLIEMMRRCKIDEIVWHAVCHAMPNMPIIANE